MNRLMLPRPPGVSDDLHIEITRFGTIDGALFWSYGPRIWLAWALRKVADRVDQTMSYTFSGRLPPNCDRQDWRDAMVFGAGAMGRYLADVSLERALD